MTIRKRGKCDLYQLIFTETNNFLVGYDCEHHKAFRFMLLQGEAEPTCSSKIPVQHPDVDSKGYVAFKIKICK